MPSEDMDRRSRKSCGAGEIYRVASFKSLADAEQLCDTSPTTGRPGGRTWQAINIPDPPKIRTMFSPLKWCVNGVGRVWDEAFLPLTRRKPCPFFTSILWPGHRSTCHPVFLTQAVRKMFAAFAPVSKGGSKIAITQATHDHNVNEASPLPTSNVAVGVVVARKKAKTVAQTGAQDDDDELKTVYRIQCGAMLLTWNFKETPRPPLGEFKTFLTNLGAVRTSLCFESGSCDHVRLGADEGGKDLRICD
eukprot:267779-Prymnesium_polylepis.2